MRSAPASPALDPEPGLVVIWPNCRPHDARILELLSERLAIVDVTELWWSPRRVLENYNRFYRTRVVPPYRTSVMHDKGVGPALVITVVDRSPQYGLRKALSGERTVSTHAFDMKADIRAEVGGGPSIHSADSPADARRELMMLLGRDLLDPHDWTPWDGVIRAARRDVIGADGWRTVGDLFHALDAAGTYLVLRNYEGLPDSLLRQGHNDIDLLTSSYRDIVAMARARPLTGVLPRHGGRFHVDIGGAPVVCDIRVVGDGYYPARWGEALLASRRRYKDLTWVPSEPEYHESLLYHALVHKPSLSAEYRARLDDMASKLQMPERTLGDDPERPRKVLFDVLSQRGFEVATPKDPTVFFNHRIVDSRAPLLMRLIDAVHRRAYRVGMRYVRRPGVAAVRTTREWVLATFPTVRTLGRMTRRQP